MTHLTSTLLAGLNDANEFFDKLQMFNIRHLEQLASLMISGPGRAALREVHNNVDFDAIEDAIKRSAALQIPSLKSALQNANEPTLPRNSWTRRGYGFSRSEVDLDMNMYDEIDQNKIKRNMYESFCEGNKIGLDFVRGMGNMPGDTLPEKSFLYRVGAFPPPKDQGARGTCVAFAATALLKSYQMRFGAPTDQVRDYSEQYLYYRAKLEDRDRAVEGTSIDCAMQALKTFGVCLATDLPYRPFVDWSHELLFDNSVQDLHELNQKAAAARIKEYCHLPANGLVDTIKACIAVGLPVAVGVLVFREAWGNDYTIWKGEIELPIVRESEDGKTILLDTCEGGHAVCIVGYEDDVRGGPNQRPGGGAFIFKNSWGHDWASSSEHGRGYGLLPYDYVSKYCLEACIITGV